MATIQEFVNENGDKFDLIKTNSKIYIDKLDLFILVEQNDVITIENILNDCPERIYEKEPHFNNSLLHVSCKKGLVELTKLLILKGIRINDTNMDGVNPIMEACNWNRIEIVKILIEKGANLYSEDNSNMTPLFWAARKGSDNITLLSLSNITINLNFFMILSLYHFS
jgi:ankyrin repeat protein